MKRDYKTLTSEEREQWEAIVATEEVTPLGKHQVRRTKWREYPKAVRHHLSLFPNQFLDPVDLDDPRFQESIEALEALLDRQSTTERDVLSFINEGRQSLVGSLLNRNFPFGHHEAYVFSEFPLGTSCVVDYLLVGRSSDGWNFVFVELERPNGQVTTKNGEFSTVITKGIRQVESWEAWVDSNYSCMNEVFEKHRNKNEPMPSEFRDYDRTRIHYVVIAGRRHDFNGTTYQRKRKKTRDNALLVLHYDNLIDCAKGNVGCRTF